MTAGEVRARQEAGRAGQASSTWRLDLAYQGTAYHGWAAQPGERTVEGTMSEALRIALREPVRLSVAGRTDAGVHAWAQVASFVTGSDLHPHRLRHSLNALLPPDIAVQAITQVPSTFVAREAVSRTYRYTLWLSPVKPVRDRPYVWHVRGPVDAAALSAAAALLPGTRDFAALTPSAHLYHSCVRRVLEARWSPGESDELGPATGASAGPLDVRDSSGLVFTITAGSFLHNMVRVAVGSMVDVAQGRLSLKEFGAALESCDRRRAGRTAPARGLALVAVRY